MADDLGAIEVLTWLAAEIRKLHVEGTSYWGVSEEGAKLLETGGSYPVSQVSIAHASCVICGPASKAPGESTYPCKTLKLVERAERGVYTRHEPGELARRDRSRARPDRPGGGEGAAES